MTDEPAMKHSAVVMSRTRKRDGTRLEVGCMYATVIDKRVHYLYFSTISCRGIDDGSNSDGDAPESVCTSDEKAIPIDIFVACLSRKIATACPSGPPIRRME